MSTPSPAASSQTVVVLPTALLRTWRAISLVAFSVGAAFVVLVCATASPAPWALLLLAPVAAILPAGQLFVILSIPMRWEGRFQNGRRAPRRAVTVSDLFGPSRPGRTVLALVLAATWIFCAVLVVVAQPSAGRPIVDSACDYTSIDHGVRTCVTAARAAGEQGGIGLLVTAFFGFHALALDGALARRRAAS